jgi:hypothetical protein
MSAALFVVARAALILALLIGVATAAGASWSGAG